jgi:hypothetical protein
MQTSSQGDDEVTPLQSPPPEMDRINEGELDLSIEGCNPCGMYISAIQE